METLEQAVDESGVHWMPYHVRPMEVGDVPQVGAIEREAFPTSWPPLNLRRELDNRWVRYLIAYTLEASREVNPRIHTNRHGPSSQLGRWWRSFLGKPPTISAQETRNGERIAGYVGIWFMTEEAHLTSLASQDNHRRQGVGELLLISSIELAMLRHARVLSLEVRVSNEAAQALYEKYGFRRMGVRKRYYTDNNEDAYVMTTDVITSPSYQALFQQMKESHQ